MDLLFLIVIAVIYGVTHALVWAIARLRGEQ